LEAKLPFRAPKKGGEEVSEQFTNCRAQAQLKSTDSTKQNQDGSVSYQIEVSNLNYLLNGPCPIYFLWIQPAAEMRYVWAREEWRRLDAENSAWKEQGTFTVRFREVLSATAVEAIHERVIAEARLGREVHETLARGALAERVIVSIDPKSLASDDPEEVFERITASGMTIVSSGYGSLLLRWLDVLPGVTAQPPQREQVVAVQTGVADLHAHPPRRHVRLRPLTNLQRRERVIRSGVRGIDGEHLCGPPFTRNRPSREDLQRRDHVAFQDEEETEVHGATGEGAS
jgi:hypothetical protein